MDKERAEMASDTITSLKAKNEELREIISELIEEAEYAAECCGMSDDEQEVVDSIKEKIDRAKQALKESE